MFPYVERKIPHHKCHFTERPGGHEKFSDPPHLQSVTSIALKHPPQIATELLLG